MARGRKSGSPVELGQRFTGLVRYLGPSSDHRTNRWEVTCPHCGTEYRPSTTMGAKQEVECPGCALPMLADYNAEPPTLLAMEARNA